MKYTNIIFALTTTLIILQIADITTTMILLSVNTPTVNGIETNPFANISILQASLKLGLSILLGLLATVPLKYSHPNFTHNEQNYYKKLMLTTISFLILIYIGVVVNNTYWITIANGVV